MIGRAGRVESPARPARTPPMVEPTTSRGRITRERIVEAAAELFHLHGVHGTGISRILAAAGAGKGQFYHYFGGKAELVAEVLRLQWERVRRRQAEAVARRSGWPAVRAWFEAIYRAHAERGFAGGCPIGSIAAEMGGDDEAVRRRAEAIFATQREDLVALLAGLDGGHSAATLEALADFCIATVQGGLLLAATRCEGAPLRHAIDHALAHLEAALGAAPASRAGRPRRNATSV